MTLTRKALIQSLAESCFPPEEGYITHKDRQGSLGKATRAVDAILSTIALALSAGEEIRLIGFGTFEIQAYPERQGRNPRTGLPLTVKASKRIRFKPGKLLKDAVSGEEKPISSVKAKASAKAKGKAEPKSSLAKKK